MLLAYNRWIRARVRVTGAPQLYPEIRKGRGSEKGFKAQPWQKARRRLHDVYGLRQRSPAAIVP
jgi:hypothetical protein